ncbi:deoxyribose-phosphate aldolase [Olsenella sp. YH-ols2217]|uniref:Deoxyribose-phosphate aldolase n=1 Tax=Kribbibacterium absianum TaxID=3044210 RepID=A0ABT6ZL62_9ACTN|nr:MULTISPECIES: deoxyribose-phosphate aldolase [unclassified Olsenella]MDJ1121778.1 deoxyribose-phosphate aldolase [Olsenella sp. YH-ols2216]MDJ1129786.1 deoxyribose-phosphate aldolase [Olsenella sp. YH-ols2217]
MKPTKPAVEMTQAELARYIDHSVLKPEFTAEEIVKHTKDAVDFGCATVCVNPASLPLVAPIVEGTDTGICVVCDFPFGLSTPESKAAQAEAYCSEYDIEDLDIVANYGRLRSGDLDYVVEDLKGVVEAAHKHGTKVKVIIETDALTPEQIADGTRCAVEAGADFIKSSTGFYTGGEQHGATPEVVQMMMDAGEGKIAVKGSGCIRDQERFFQLIDMGIDRMGIGYRSTPVVLGLA